MHVCEYVRCEKGKKIAGHIINTSKLHTVIRHHSIRWNDQILVLISGERD